MAHITVDNETQTRTGWSFDVTVATGAHEGRHTVTLSYADYEHWSHGRHAPARVVEAVVRYVLRAGRSDGLRPAFDAARARRLAPAIDEELPGLL